MSNLFYAFRKMELKNNVYGFVNNGTKLNNDGTIKEDSNKLDVHMIKVPKASFCRKAYSSGKNDT